jgi:hypothetical protein
MGRVVSVTHYTYSYTMCADRNPPHSWWFQGLIFTGIWVIGHEVRLTIIFRGFSEFNRSRSVVIVLSQTINL